MAPPSGVTPTKPVTDIPVPPPPADSAPPPPPADSVPPPPPAVPPAKPAAPSKRTVVEHRTGTPTSTVTLVDDRFVLRGYLGVTGGALGGTGGPNGGLFKLDSNPATNHGDFTFINAGVGVPLRLGRAGSVSFFAEPRLDYFGLRSGRNAGGSHLDGVRAGGDFAIDWSRTMSSWPILLPSRFALGASYMYATGETDAGNHASIADTHGHGAVLRASIDLLGIKVNDSGSSLRFGWQGETSNIWHARGDANLPMWNTGAFLALDLPAPGSERQITRVDTNVELCRADKPTLESLVQELKAKQEEAVARYAEFLGIAKHLDKKGITAEKVLAALRTGYIKTLEATLPDEDAPATAARAAMDAEVAKGLEAKKAGIQAAVDGDKSLKTAEAKAKKLTELTAVAKAELEAAYIKEHPLPKTKLDTAVEAALAAKKAEFEKTVAEDKSLKTPAAKAAKLAELNAAEKAKVEAAFLAEKRAGLEAKAKEKFPDGYNHFALDLPDGVVNVSADDFQIPEACSDEANSLFDRLIQDRSKLDIFLTRIEERTKFMFFALGSPKTSKVVDALGGISFAQLPPLYFQQSQPDYDKKNEGPGKRGRTMDRVEKFLENNKGKTFKANDPSFQAAFRGIFQGNELARLESVVRQFNGEEELRGVRKKKMSPEEYKKMIKEVPILIEAHVSVTDGSTEGNQILSDNRARAIEVAMILMGMDPARLRSVGAGESNPIVPETVDWTKKGKKLPDYADARKINRRVMFLVDDEKLEAAGSKLTPTGAKPPATEKPSGDGRSGALTPEIDLNLPDFEYPTSLPGEDKSVSKG